MPRNARAAAAPAANIAVTPTIAALEARIAALVAELRDSEERHARIIAAVAEGIYEWDVERNVLWPSPRLIEIFGFHGRELTASDWNQLIHPEDFERYRAALRDCFKEMTPRLDCEYRVRHSDGAYRWIEDRAVPVRNPAGRAIRLTGAITDITDRKAAEQALRESLEYQTATSDVLKVISRSTFDLQPVLDTLVETAVRLCNADKGMIASRNGEIYQTASSFAYSPDWDRLVRRLTFEPGRGTVVGRTALAGQAVHVADVAADPEYTLSEAVSHGKTRTALGVPLLRKGEPFGVIYLARQRVEPFTDRQIELVRTFADQAVIAIENTRLITETREALERQTAIGEVLSVISRSVVDLGAVLETVVVSAVRLCRADQAVIYRNEDGEYRWAAGYSLAPDYERIERDTRIVPGTGSLVGRAALEGRTVQIDDAWTDPLYQAKEDARVGGVRSMLGVPLLRDGAVIGVIGLARRRVEPYSEREKELVTTFADQAVIAIENTRLITETRAALEQQTATAEVLQVINASPGDLAPVFDAMLEKAMQLCEAAFGGLWTFEGDRYVAAALRGVPPAYAEFLSRTTLLPGPGSAPDRFRRGERSVIQNIDLKAEELYRAGDPQRRALVDLGGARTAMQVPLCREDAALGVITLYRQEVRPFADQQIALLQNFAAQAVIAMENARLLGELRERTRDLEESLEYQTATSDVLQVISRSTFDLQPVLDTLVATATRLCAAEVGHLAIRQGDAYRYVATLAADPEWDKAVRARPFLPGRGTIAGRTIASGQVVQVPDLGADPEYDMPEAVALGKLRTTLGVPLLREGQPVGVITLARQRVEPFTERQIELVRTFADQAVIAIENTRLLTELRESLEQQQAIAEVLGVINSSPGDLAPVFGAMIEKAIRLCEAQTAHLLRYEEPYFTRAASLGVSEDFDKILPLNTPVPHIITRDSVPYRMLASRAVVHVRDIREDESVRAGAPAETAAAASGIRTILFVPLLKEGEVVGGFVMHRMEVRPFSDKQIALLENFAAQAVIAMENARLLQEIRQRQTELRVTFDNMGDGVAMFDAGLRLAAWNTNFQRMLDMPDEFLATRPISAEFVRYLATHGEYGAVDVEAEVRRLTDSVGTQWSSERTRPDGRVIEVRHNPVPGGGFVLIYGDVTERKRAEAEIRAARDAAEAALGELKAAQAQLIHTEKMASLGQLTAGIAHEIKNPLNFVNNFAGLSVELLDELKEMAEPGIATLDDGTRADIDETIGMLTSNMEKIAEHGSRADGIVKSMLAHSRGSSGERQRVDLNALVDEALNLAYHGARAQDPGFNITLEREFAPGLAPIELVPQDITRVFLNLIGNGFYAATKRRDQAADPAFRPVLKVATRELGHAVEIAVRDNGTGIAPQLREKLFQPFFTTKPTGEGTGLGLSISYDIVTQEHGGTIAVDSQIGAFTEFTVHLPRARPTATAELSISSRNRSI